VQYRTAWHLAHRIRISALIVLENSPEDQRGALDILKKHGLPTAD
jgi:hypothetical protein